MVVAGAFVRLLRLAAVMADATDGQPATDFANPPTVPPQGGVAYLGATRFR